MALIQTCLVMFLGYILYFSLICTAFPTVVFDKEGTADISSLQLVHLVYRHGDRTPSAEFPTDPTPGIWPQGFGELTNLGKMQQYELGKFLKKRYLNGFMNSSYNDDEITVRSTDKSRTLMSAYTNLAGLYPPKDHEKWNPNLDWQPIPVHTLPKDEDQLLYMTSNCPRYMQIYNEFINSEYYQGFLEDKRVWIDFVSQKAGVETEIEAITSVYDNLFCKTAHNISLPNWANSTVMQELKEIQEFKMESYFYLPEMKILKGGVLLGEMIENTALKVTEPEILQKMYMYSAHDSTLVAFLLSLNVFNHMIVSYAACVMVELHKQAGNLYFVQVLYKNSTSEDTLHVLTIPGCQARCPWEKFLELTKNSVPTDIEKECQIKEETNFVTTSIVIVILLIILLTILITGLIFSRKCMARLPYLPQGL